MATAEMTERNRRFLAELLAPSTLRRATAIREVEKYVNERRQNDNRPLPELTVSLTNPFVEQASPKDPVMVIADGQFREAEARVVVGTIYGISLRLASFSQTEDIREFVWRSLIRKGQDEYELRDVIHEPGAGPQGG